MYKMLYSMKQDSTILLHETRHQQTKLIMIIYFNDTNNIKKIKNLIFFNDTKNDLCYKKNCSRV